jgi:hypothetical protein
MARFLIEVAHEPEVLACVRVVEVFLRTGSHFLTHADWGCKDGVHKAWVIAELDSKSDALNIVPADFRSRATVVQLNTFSLDQIDELRRHHDAAE